MKLHSLAAAITAAALTLGGIAAASAAYAGGSDSTTPYTVDASGITLPAGTVFEDGGHINIRTDHGDRGIHFEGKCVTRTDAECAGEAHAVALLIGQGFAPWDVFTLPALFCVTWVQVAGFNEHFGEGGQSPVCVGTPTTTAPPTGTSTPTWTPTETPPATSTPTSTPPEPTSTPTAPSGPVVSPPSSVPPTSAAPSPTEPSASAPTPSPAAVTPLSPNSSDAARFVAPSPAGSAPLAATGDSRLPQLALLLAITICTGILIVSIVKVWEWRSRR